jgi:hypothetical protein
MSQAALGELPLQDAVYVASTNKIYGISGIYVVKLNATTGAVESTVRISSPVNNGARICYHAANNTLYASVWNEPNLGDTTLTHPNKDVYPINPATMTVGPRLNLTTTLLVTSDFDASLNPSWGPMWIGSSGDYLYVQWMGATSIQFIRVNPINLADRSTQARSYAANRMIEQAAIGATYFMYPDPFDERFYYAPIGWNLDSDFADVDTPAANYPIACEYCSFDGLFYGLDGNGTMYRINDPITENIDVIAIPPTVAVPTPDPCRLRWNAYTGLLYLPCMTDNAIVTYDPDLVAWDYKTGFENPVDCVFTPDGKEFAVQNSPNQPLKEIT